MAEEKFRIISRILFGIFVAMIGVNMKWPLQSQAHDIDINNPTSCPRGTMNITAKRLCCKNMNKIRRPFLDCCIYPRLVIWRWQYDLCVAQCNEALSTGYTPATYRCCLLTCCYRYLKVLTFNPIKDGVNMTGIMFSFSISVGNDTRWVDVIRNSVTLSDRQFREDVKNMTGVTDPAEIKAYENYWDCFELVPMYLRSVIDMTYNQNYLQCPTFNNTLDRCDIARQYVQDCFVDGDE